MTEPSAPSPSPGETYVVAAAKATCAAADACAAAGALAEEARAVRRKSGAHRIELPAAGDVPGASEERSEEEQRAPAGPGR